MMDYHYIPLKTMAEEFHLEVVFAASDYNAIRLTVADVTRPGLQLAGYMDHFEPMRLQVMGNAETSYLRRLSPAARYQVLDKLFSYKFPAMLIARNIEPDPECLEIAKKHDVTVLRTGETTSSIISSIISYLNAQMAGRITRSFSSRITRPCI